jgi:hypothetical protein
VTFGGNGQLQRTQSGRGGGAFDDAGGKRHDKVCLRAR